MAVTIDLSVLNGDWDSNGLSGNERIWTKGVYSIVHSDNMFNTSNAGWIVKITNGVEIFGIKTITGDVWQSNAEIIWNPKATGYDADTTADLVISVIKDANPIDINPAYYKCNSVNGNTWSGYKMSWDNNINSWFSELTLTNELPVQGFTPETDKVYNVNTTSLIYLYPNEPTAQVIATTASASDIKNGKTAVLNGTLTTGTMATSSATKSGNTVSITEGYKTAETITVGTAKGAQTYTPGTSNQTIGADIYLTGTQTIQGDSNLVASNIKKGVSIFGIPGSYESSNVSPSLPEVTVTSDKMLSGITAINTNGEVVTGSITSKAAQTYTPGTSDQVISAGQYLMDSQIIKGDSNLVASNVKKGVSIFGVSGSFQGSGGTGGGDVEYYQCLEYDNGEALPEYDNIIINGGDAPGTYILEDKWSTGFKRIWYNNSYRIFWDDQNVCWCLCDRRTSTTMEEKNALYTMKIEGLSQENGSSENPVYWDTYVTNSERTNFYTSNVYNDMKCYIYVKLKANTSYIFAVVQDYEWVERNIQIQDLNGSVLVRGSSDDDHGMTNPEGKYINNYCKYTPTSDQMVKVNVFAGGVMIHNVNVLMNVAPEISLAPSADLTAGTWVNKLGTATIQSTIKSTIGARNATNNKTWKGAKVTFNDSKKEWDVDYNNIVTGLNVTINEPLIGKTYSSDTMTMVSLINPLTENNNIVALFHGDCDFYVKNSEQQFSDDLKTCIVVSEYNSEYNTDSSYQSVKFGKSAWLLTTTYTEANSTQGSIVLKDLPLMNDAFTIEWWIHQRVSTSADNLGGVLLQNQPYTVDSHGYEMIQNSTLNISVVNPTKNSKFRKENQWVHHALVRQSGNNYVTHYIDGCPQRTYDCSGSLGGQNTRLRILNGGKELGGSVNANRSGDQLAVFNYARYTNQFMPPTSPYEYKRSKFSKTTSTSGNVKVSDIVGLIQANGYFTLTSGSATGTAKVWTATLTNYNNATNNYYLRYSESEMTWVISSQAQESMALPGVGSAIAKMYDQNASYSSQPDFSTMQPINSGYWVQPLPNNVFRKINVETVN